MTRIITKVMFTVLIVASTHLYADNYDFKPGSWETTSTTKIIEIDAPPEFEKMMRSMSKMPVYTEIECIKNIASIFDSKPDDEEACKTEMKRVTANKIAVEMSCTGPDGDSKGVGEMDLNGKTFTSWLEMTTSQDAMKMKMKIVGSGKYIGACD